MFEISTKKTIHIQKKYIRILIMIILLGISLLSFELSNTYLYLYNIENKTQTVVILNLFDTNYNFLSVVLFLNAIVFLLVFLGYIFYKFNKNYTIKLID